MLEDMQYEPDDDKSPFICRTSIQLTLFKCLPDGKMIKYDYDTNEFLKHGLSNLGLMDIMGFSIEDVLGKTKLKIERLNDE